MDKFGKSQPVKRVEDARFLTGQGRYVDDIAPENALHGFVFRSPVAHGAITTLNVDDAREADGVHLVVTLDDLEAAGVHVGMAGATVPNRDGTRGASPERPVLARGRLRFVGEAIAMIFAETLQQAKDAAELIELDYDDLPVSLALDTGAHDIHPEAPGNLAYDYGLGDEAATNAAFDAAAKVVSLQIDDNRIIVNSLEPRGCYAEVEGERLHVAINGQGVWGAKASIAKAMAMAPEQVRITNPDVGGGFGMKGMDYPEHVVCAFAARALGRPVRWMSERTEAMLSDNGGRDLTTLAEMAFDDDHRILAYRIHTRNNLGAYNSGYGQPIQSELFAKVMMGVYDVQTAFMGVRGYYTNTTQVDAYRGAGRPEAIYVLERLMDRAARELNVDGWELRRKNFIAPEKFPYQSVTGELYDVGDFNRVLSRVETTADRAGFLARRAQSEAAGKLRGMGLCYYIESILGDPSEDVKVAFEEDGSVSMYVGTQSNGQGHETVYAKFLSDQTGIPADRIRVIQGDSDLIARGGGTGGSRSVTTQANVTLTAVSNIVAAFTPFLADTMGVEESKVTFDDETFRAEGSNMTPTLLEAAALAREAGREDLLTHAARSKLPGRSYPNGAHVAEVEVDPETGAISVDRYTVVDDFGNLINPMLAEGQVHGGVAQGIGQAITERVVFDEEGQLLTATFMDYGMPRADNLPMIGFDTEPVPSTANPMGMKGCGEAGTVGAMAAMGNAVQDALWDRGVRQADMPFTPMRVWSMLKDASETAA
ncbi:xanthine dehydrogenase family protein molybdopterin-binding subunit [Marinovum sp. 2_MG-2023]|uniref:xanthine dehydrogenase family protein molybdopterin-binding subunit n=1 Tax=unclassified Marinovum TaxID=2647166 RepID=UPI0026E1DF87|nr:MULTISPECIES: xanthine dehydrogenase family protein molybdopterin-binding subunit [unclassified Marinovum]MDO6730279.1 xanthine dehydrogenase family protein molybdopterin-binding subunit [Marinovum sp. 2_MG-2023]MDO6779017.1 xanthine dehydrogenase family protein molybdopterin-binding subunit [Marinovum sp. 1_MG-2023]